MKNEMQSQTVSVRDMFGSDLTPALKKAAKSKGVSVGDLMRRIRKEYPGRIPAWMRNECYAEWLVVNKFMTA